MQEELYIKNMVCNRCIMVVREQLERLHLPVTQVSLGKVLLSRPLEPGEKKKLEEKLLSLGFELLDNKRSKLIERIKSLVIKLVHENREEKPLNMKYSEFLEKEVGMEYSGISKLFSETEGMTIEQYLIQQKVERIKELLVYDELSISEIAYQLGYSSVAHLSSQFKKVTGHTPKEFKTLHDRPRRPLDQV